ncbi:hypothetical protein HU200_031115 [Digitaria exilis]|uniref:Uncharacterized protein n=1 Tax=Digitaria exilis TaxID=1010633 RepID=A0A835BQM6_9POAL|nr:hypothetical protein HU200_031115 [Digitaria exilis]
MASPPPPGAPAWSVAMRLRHRCGLDFRAAAENVLPGWGRGGEQLSLLFRFRRRLILTVTSQCSGGACPAAATQPEKTTPSQRGCKILRFLRSRWARLPRIASVWRRKRHHPPARIAAAAASPRGRRAQVISSPVFLQSRTPTLPGFLAMAGTPTSAAAALRFAVVVVVASIVLLRIAVFIGCWKRIAGLVKFLELMEHPPPYCKWLLGVPKRALQWIFTK